MAAFPAQPVSVIIQKSSQDQRLEDAVTLLGGVVTKDLSLINAFVAELPASQVQQVASLPSVHWVSLDAPVVESTCTECH